MKEIRPGEKQGIVGRRKSTERGEQFRAKFGNASSSQQAKFGKANGSQQAEEPTPGFLPILSVCTGEWCGVNCFLFVVFQGFVCYLWIWEYRSTQPKIDFFVDKFQRIL